MVPLFKYTGWDTTTFDRNVRRLFTEIVYKRIAHDPTEAMRKANSQEKRVQKKLPQEWLDFLRLMVDTIFDVANSSGSFTPEMAQALLSYKPEDISRGTGMMCDYIEGFDAVEKYLRQVAFRQKSAAKSKAAFTRVVTIALFSYIKHSGNLEGEKKTIRQRVHDAAAATDDAKAALCKIYAELAAATASGGLRPVWAMSKHSEHAARLTAVLGEKVNPAAAVTSEASAGAADAAALAVAPSTPAEILAKVPGSAAAVKILDKLGALSPASFKGGFGDYSAIVGADAHTVRSMVEAMLLAWRTRDGCIDAGMAALAGSSADENPEEMGDAN